MNYQEHGSQLVAETRRYIEELELAIDQAKQDLLEQVELLAESINSKQLANVLFSLYYEGEKIVRVTDIRPIADDYKIPWSDVTSGHIVVVCSRCGAESEASISSRTNYNSLKKNINNIICNDCARKQEERRSQASQRFRNEREARFRELNTMPYHEYLKTEEWKQTRMRAYRRAGYKCELCHSGGELHVHHKTYERRGQEYAKDLIVLCKSCHAKFHDKLPREREQ